MLYNNNKETANDFKVFMGKCAEIKAIEKSNRVVNGKWYLAWDTGEIYVGNGVNRLIKFGGSANNLSKDEIEKLIKDCTVEDLRAIRTQLVECYNRYNVTDQNMVALKNSVESSVNTLNTHTLEYVKQKIDEVVDSESSLSYSKSTIDTKLSDLKIDISNSYVSNEQNIENLKQYTTYDYINQNQLAYATGDKLLITQSTGGSGYFFCVSDSPDVPITFEKGHFYFITNGTADDIGAAGSGTAVDTTSLTVYFDGKRSDTIMIGESYSKNITMTFDITNIKNFVNTLTLYQDGTILKANISPNSSEVYVNTTLGMQDIGTKIFSLVGTDRKNNTIKSEFELNVVGPVYYGCANSAIPESDVIKAFHNRLDSAAGTYTISVENDKYVWICVPSNESISKITLNGFTAPFNEPENKVISFNGISNTYKCYRSTNSLKSSNIVLQVE